MGCCLARASNGLRLWAASECACAQSQEISQRRTYAYLPSAWLALQIKKKFPFLYSHPIKTRAPPNKICLSLAGQVHTSVVRRRKRNGMLGNSLLDGSKRTYCAHMCCAAFNHYLLYINQTGTKALTFSVEYSPTTLCPFPFTLHIFQVISFRFSVSTKLHIPYCHEKKPPQRMIRMAASRSS